MQQERPNCSADSSVSEFAKARIAREKERLAALGVTIPQVEPKDIYSQSQENTSQTIPQIESSTPHTDDFPDIHLDGSDETTNEHPSDSIFSIDSTFCDDSAFHDDSAACDLDGEKSSNEFNDFADKQEFDGKHFEAIEYDKATPEQQKVYDEVTNGIESKDKNIRAGRRRKNGSIVLLNPYYERKRKEKVNALLRVVLWLCFIVAVVVIVTGIDYVTSTHTGDRLRSAFLYSDKDDRAFHERFEPIENYVTLGDNAERIEEILGTPDRMDGTLYYYGDSYLIVEEDRIIGFYRDPTESLAVTLGFQGEKAAGKVLVGDSAQNVVYRLGTPDYCFYQNWLYLNCNGTAETVGQANTNFEVNFNEKGIVVSCHELKR